eukprot:TRINITY_DN60247_c0_g1_i1.p1 TRINITY_DN60247_c0_g1~~TRINITY_DN60247_c0_g1_i1.p1  ORF type:complete len:126 (+),score=33.00 TRINITY_DN60247_c0_g1_i1:203-580(+)
MPGVVSTRVGYTGGPAHADSPTYDTVCAGDGHTEALRIVYDPAQLSYEELLKEFWRQASPSGGSSCAQYKHAIWTTTPEQAAVAAQQVAELERARATPVTLDVQTAGPWHDAEEYHQQYLAKQGY